MTKVAARSVKTAQDAGEKRCIVTGEMRPKSDMIRFVVAPSGEIVADVAATLPGRGLWVTADKEILKRAAASNAFSKAARAPVKVGEDLPGRVEGLIAKRMTADLGLARKAGLLVLGFDCVLKSLNSAQPPALLVEAAEAAADGRRKLAATAAARGVAVRVVDGLKVSELRLALGRENVIHAAVKPGPLANRLILDGARLKGLQTSQVDGTAGRDSARNERNA
jgi:uncharacterized protein